MSSKTKIIIQNNEETCRNILQGMRIAHDAVVATMGPHGKYVLIKTDTGNISFSKDGSTVADAINGDLGINEIVNIGAELIRKVSKQMNEEAGDGSTTVTRLTYEICKVCYSLLTSNAPLDIYNALQEFKTLVIHELENMKKQIHIHDISKIATLAANNNEEIGQLVQQAFTKLGLNGVVLVEKSHNSINSVEIKQGFCMPFGPSSDIFFLSSSGMQDPNSVMKITLYDPYIVIFTFSPNIHDLLNILDTFSTSQQPLVIVAESFSKDFMTVIGLYISRRNLKCITIVPQGYDKNDIIEDLSVFTNGKIYNDSDLTSGVMINEFGRAEKITITQKSIVISGGKGSDANIKEKINILTQSAKNSGNFQINKNEKRIAMLSSGIATILVGDPLLYGLVENAIQASKKSLESGVVPGAGIDFIQIYDTLQTYNFKNPLSKSFLNILLCIFKQILDNAGLDSGIIIEKSRQSQFTLIPDVMKNGEMTDYRNIISPLIVSIKAIELACSTSNYIIFLNKSIIQKIELTEDSV